MNRLLGLGLYCIGSTSQSLDLYWLLCWACSSYYAGPVLAIILGLYWLYAGPILAIMLGLY